MDGCSHSLSLLRWLGLGALVAVWTGLLWLQFIRERDHARNNYAGLFGLTLMNTLLVVIVWLSARAFYCGS